MENKANQISPSFIHTEHPPGEKEIIVKLYLASRGSHGRGGLSLNLWTAFYTIPNPDQEFIEKKKAFYPTVKSALAAACWCCALLFCCRYISTKRKQKQRRAQCHKFSRRSGNLSRQRVCNVHSMFFSSKKKKTKKKKKINKTNKKTMHS